MNLPSTAKLTIALAAASMHLFMSATSLAEELKVAVRGVEASVGQVGCGLHSSSDTFPMGHQSVRTIWIKPSADSAVCVFTNVVAGEYAVAVLYDLNGNKKTDTNMIGIPTEAWGVSGNVRPSMRAPRFSEAKFEMGTSAKEISVEVSK